MREHEVAIEYRNRVRVEAESIETEADTAWTDGKEHEAWRLYLRAGALHRVAGNDEGIGRCNIRARKAWSDASGENFGE